MLQTSLDAVRSILKSDPSVTPSARARYIALLREGPKIPPSEVGSLGTPRILRRGAAAERLGVSPRCIDRLAQQGLLQKVRLPGRTRCAGFREAEINALISAAGGAA